MVDIWLTGGAEWSLNTTGSTTSPNKLLEWIRITQYIVSYQAVPTEFADLHLGAPDPDYFQVSTTSLISSSQDNDLISPCDTARDNSVTSTPSKMFCSVLGSVGVLFGLRHWRTRHLFAHTYTSSWMSFAVHDQIE